MSFVGSTTGREGPQGDTQIFQADHGPPGGDTDDAAGRIGGPAFGGTGDHDVAAIGIEEDIPNTEQAGQVAHLIGDRAILLANGIFQVLQRDVTYFAAFCRLGVQSGADGGLLFLGKPATLIGGRFQLHDAGRIDNNSGGLGKDDLRRRHGRGQHRQQHYPSQYEASRQHRYILLLADWNIYTANG